MTTPREFRVTFGQQYAREAHPTLPEAHPDGWLAVFATSEEEARSTAFAVCGPRWAFLYDTAETSPGVWDLYPLGELARVEAGAGAGR